MEESWEALDLDDSDISSSFSLLRRCHLQPPLPRPIPGPASTIQSSFHRLHHQNSELTEISTQDYVRTCHQDSSLEFSRDPWLFSLQSPCAFDATPLKDINNCFHAHRFDKVVAVVKSCTPNGHGDMILTLKDPTDTISASLHREVVSAGEFGKLITVGSVLILQKVIAFPSSCASCCLNITRRNVVKVISVDCEIQYFPELNPDSAQVCSKNTKIPVNTSLVSRRTSFADVHPSYNLNDNTTIQKPTAGRKNLTQASSLSKEPILKDLFSSSQRACESSGKWRASSSRAILPGSETTSIAANCEDVDTVNQCSWQQNGPQLERLLRGTNGTTTMTGKRRNPPLNSTTEKLKGVDCCTPDEAQKHGLETGISSSPSLVNNLTNRELSKPEIAESGGIKKQRLGLISRPSIQEWTDEQLCVLEIDDD